MKAILQWFREYNNHINWYCREVCMQRDRDLREYRMLRDICRLS